MSDAELEQLIHTLQQLTLEWYIDLDAEEDFESEVVLHLPATPAQIDECEAFLGRRFPKSYRHFLSLHNGWKNCLRSYDFLGTDDYQNKEIREHLAMIHQAVLGGWDAPIQGLPIETFYPEHIYRLIDSASPVSPTLQPLKSFLDDFNETSSDLCFPKHTCLNLGDSTVNFLLVNDKSSGNEEMEIAWYFAQGGGQGRHPNFYSLLEALAEAEQADS